MNGRQLTYQELYNMAADTLDSRFDAGQLFTHVTQKRVQHLPHIGHKPVPPGQERILMKMCEQRRSGVPLQYLLGEWEFYGLPFKVGRGVLIPRQDTEVLVDTALELLRGLEGPSVLDLCSGTGCVAIAVSHTMPNAEVTALELSEFAFDYLLQNIALNECHVAPVRGDLHNYIHPGCLDMITCNPPYIPAETLSTLQAEVWFEPRRALSGGRDGLDFYHSISKMYRPQLKDGGWICFEVGIGQSARVMEILDANLYGDIFQRDDLNGIPRVVCGRKLEA